MLKDNSFCHSIQVCPLTQLFAAYKREKNPSILDWFESSMTATKVLFCINLCKWLVELMTRANRWPEQLFAYLATMVLQTVKSCQTWRKPSTWDRAFAPWYHFASIWMYVLNEWPTRITEKRWNKCVGDHTWNTSSYPHHNHMGDNIGDPYPLNTKK